MYTSMEGSCYIENSQLFSNFQWGFRDQDMVRLNECPLVSSTGLNCKVSTEAFFAKWNVCWRPSADRFRFKIDWNQASVVDCECGQTFWPTMSPQWDPSASGKRGRGASMTSHLVMSAAWVIQESYSQVKLWPFNGTYCKGICWSLSSDTNSFNCCIALSVFAQRVNFWPKSMCIWGFNGL